MSNTTFCLQDFYCSNVDMFSSAYWDFEGRMGQLWLNQQPSNMHLSQGSQYFPREHPNSSTGMHMMLGGNMISQMSGVPNDYNNSQQRLQAERNMGVPHLTGFPMTGRQSAQTQASTHFAREVRSFRLLYQNY